MIDDINKNSIREISLSMHCGVVDYNGIKVYGTFDPLTEFSYQKYAWNHHRQDLAEISPQRNFTVTRNG